MCKRTEEFHKLKGEVMHAKIFNKLSPKEISECEKFFLENKDLNRDEFAHKAVRWFLDKQKPKNWVAMEDLVTTANFKSVKKTI